MGSSTPRIGTQRYRPCEGAHAATHFHIHSYARMYTPTHTSRCTHADTATRALTQVHVPRHSALSPVRKYSASLALSLHPSIPSIHHSFLGFSVCAKISPKPQTEGASGWGGDMEAEGRPLPQALGRGRGRGGLREQAGGAPGPPARRAAAALGRCARPSRGLPNAFPRSLPDAPRRR